MKSVWEGAEKIIAALSDETVKRHALTYLHDIADCTCDYDELTDCIYRLSDEEVAERAVAWATRALADRIEGTQP